MILLLFVLKVLTSFFNKSQAASSCYWNTTLIKNSTRCSWTYDRNCNVLVNCRIKAIKELMSCVVFPEVVKELDISRNELTNIKENTLVQFKKLVSLNLSRNNIQSLSRDAFNGLVNLKVLDLSRNSFLKWDTNDIASKLPSLSVLNVTSSPVSWPAKDIASLPNITLFQGVVSYVIPWYSNDCAYCSFIRINNRNNLQDYYEDTSETCKFRYFYLHGLNFSTVWNGNFSIICETVNIRNDICRHTQRLNITRPIISVNIVPACWREITKWTTPFIPLGLVAIVINLLVMATVASSKSLRNNVAMFFISNMAIGDFSQGLFLVSLAVTRHVMSEDEYANMISSHNAVCTGILAAFTIAQCLSVLVGFLVVLERYLCIVYSMNPDVRITKTTAKILIVCVWILTIYGISLPFIFRMRLTLDDYSCINVRAPGSKHRLTEYLGMVGVGIYCLIFIQYAHIFYTVRNSSMNVGIQRDGKLAKRIMLVISSNLFFFLAPTIIIFLFVNYETVRDRVVLFVVWNTVLFYCLGINSCINPLLYAFRNDKFRSQLKKTAQY